MDESELAKTPPARRSPAQKAASKAGLPPGVALHESAMGGFTSSGRKPKRLTPGDLSAKPKKRRKELIPAADQSLLEFSDDQIVVIPSMPIPKRPMTLEDEMDVVESADVLLPITGSLEDVARSTLAQALYHEIGKPGSLLSHPSGIAFLVRPGLGEGNCHTRHRVRIPLPGGNSATHIADFVIELDNGAMLVVDVLSAQSALADVKSHAFDALQLRGVNDCFAVLVFLTGHGGLERDQVEALAHGYDHFFGIAADHSKDSSKYSALRSRVVQWIKAAGVRK